MIELSEKTKKYYQILSKDFPEFLTEYMQTPEMERLNGITQICGAYWKKEGIYEDIYSVYKHSIAVALIVWNFTHDKKQTLAGLFHDIASPAFKHCIDFMNGDAEKQESLEDQTVEVIKNSKEIMTLLERDGIKLEEVCDYKIYPIADNETPKLSADRLEYTFMNGIQYKPTWDLDGIKEMYDDLHVFKNEDGIPELGFKTVEIAEKFIDGASRLWPLWISAEDTLVEYFFADLLKKLWNTGKITEPDLFRLSEQEVIEVIKNCKEEGISESFTKFMNCKQFIECEEEQKDKFCVSRKVKRRYINPLVQGKRVYDISEKARQRIDNYRNMKITKYACYDENACK